MNVYPSTDPANYGVRGLEWPVTRRPQFSNAIKTVTTGKEYRLKYWNNPRWHWKLSYSILFDDPTNLYLTNLYTDLRTIEGFFLGQQGTFQKFLFWDPSDNTVAGQAIATGDGVTLEFQLVRSFGGFVEAIQAPTGTINVYVDGTPQTLNVDYTIGPTGILLFAFAPGLGAKITADLSYYFPVRFEKDLVTFQEFMWQLWQQKEIELVSVFL